MLSPDQKQGRIMLDLLRRAESEGWSKEELVEKVWEEAVEWAAGLVDYSAM